ncbi:polysaccharide biosynthesis protein [Patescibacteria group bacterium]|nr:polysaccharide biosynthesis protein [Patescibacteria group bacterium]
MAKWEFGDCLITGGAGFLGRHLVKELLGRFSHIKIKVISRQENELAMLMLLCGGDKRVNPIIGDIRNIDTLKYALNEVDAVVHLAAMKHIDYCEQYPLEAIATNVTATLDLLKYFKGATFIGMSSDKAVEAIGCYGATKLLLERAILGQAQIVSSCRYMIIRSGNFFGSTGSVILKWAQQIKQNNKVMVTNPEMTRLFVDVNVVASFIIQILEQGENGKIYIPHHHRLIKLGDLAKAMIEVYGNNMTKVETVGLRKDERMHEKLFLPTENVITDDLDSELLPIDEIKEWLVNLKL